MRSWNLRSDLAACCALPVADLVEVEDLADFGQGQTHPLALQDQLHAGAVLVGIDPVQAVPRWCQEALVLIETQGPRRAFELKTQLADGEGPIGAT